MNFVRKKCELNKNNAQLEKSQKQVTLWNSQASDQKKARAIIMQYPYKQLRYFRDLREVKQKKEQEEEKPQKKNVILCLPPKSGSSSWEVLMVENLWNKSTHFLEGGVRPMSFNGIVGPSLLYKFSNTDEKSWNLFLRELSVEKTGESDNHPVRFMHTGGF